MAEEQQKTEDEKGAEEIIAREEDVEKEAQKAIDELAQRRAEMEANMKKKHEEKSKQTTETRLEVDRTQQRELLFLGGWRDTRNGAEFRNAECQTDKPPPSPEEARRRAAQKYHRETQTSDRWSEGKHGTQTTREAATQVGRRGVYIDVLGCKTLAPRPYDDADNVEKRRQAAALRIQCLVRGHLARKLARRMKAEQQKRLQKQRELEQNVVETRDREREDSLERRRNPTTVEDFQLLRRELDEWGDYQRVRLKEDKSLSEEQRREAEIDVTKKQTRMAQRIDRLRAKRFPQDRDKIVQRKLDRMCAPIKVGSQGVLVETDATRRSAELREMLESVTSISETTQERIAVLDRLQDTVQDFPCALTRDILDLSEREKTLINANLVSNLDGLRQRLRNLFFQFMESPQFNPQASALSSNIRSNTLPINPRTGKPVPLSSLPQQLPSDKK